MFFCLPSIRAQQTRPVYPGTRVTGKTFGIVDFISHPMYLTLFGLIHHTVVCIVGIVGPRVLTATYLSTLNLVEYCNKPIPKCTVSTINLFQNIILIEFGHTMIIYLVP